jgi:hypothetical protein
MTGLGDGLKPPLRRGEFTSPRGSWNGENSLRKAAAQLPHSKEAFRE